MGNDAPLNEADISLYNYQPVWYHILQRAVVGALGQGYQMGKCIAMLLCYSVSHQHKLGALAKPWLLLSYLTSARWKVNHGFCMSGFLQTYPHFPLPSLYVWAPKEEFIHFAGNSSCLAACKQSYTALCLHPGSGEGAEDTIFCLAGTHEAWSSNHLV